MKPISRRAMLATITGTAVTASLPGSGSDGLTSSSKKRPKVIVTGGHPGDPEYGCGGTIALYVARGHEVVLLYLNAGEPKGTPARERGTRTREAKNACAILKARPIYAGQIDGSAIVDPAHYNDFRKMLQAENPQAVFTHWPLDNHPDHRAMFMLVYDAWHKMNKSFALYYYEVSNGSDTMQFSPDAYADIESVVDLKRRACFAHASQSPEKFYQLQQSVTRFRGIEFGCREAEAFVRQIQSPAFPLPSA
jgi:LmbE family N-acetylglucosaminyl deacetylase